MVRRHIFQNKNPESRLFYRHFLEIETPEEYEQYKNGHITHPFYESIRIRSGIANLTDADQILAQNRQLFSVSIEDEYANRLFLLHGSRKVGGRFLYGDNHLAQLPRNYMMYGITLERDALVSTADIDAILTWTAAKDIYIGGTADVAYALSQHAGEGKLTLEKLVLSIQRRSHKQFDVTRLLERFSCKELSLKLSADLSWKERHEFVENQRALLKRTRRTDFFAGVFTVYGK